jgi:hypothetical protein
VGAGWQALRAFVVVVFCSGWAGGMQRCLLRCTYRLCSCTHVWVRALMSHVRVHMRVSVRVTIAGTWVRCVPVAFVGCPVVPGANRNCGQRAPILHRPRALTLATLSLPSLHSSCFRNVWCGRCGRVGGVVVCPAGSAASCSCGGAFSLFADAPPPPLLAVTVLACPHPILAALSLHHRNTASEDAS